MPTLNETAGKLIKRLKHEAEAWPTFQELYGSEKTEKILQILCKNFKIEELTKILIMREADVFE